MPTRIDGQLFEDAKTEGELQSRSAAQQIDHWARIGRELELSRAVTHSAIAEVLAGRERYDTLDDRAQAIVRVAWQEQISERIARLDFEEQLDAAGATWAEADDDGNVIVRHPRA